MRTAHNRLVEYCMNLRRGGRGDSRGRETRASREESGSGGGYPRER